MFKVIWLLRRKPGTTLTQFRDHYENSHAVLARRYCGHLMVGYRRNYKAESFGGGSVGEGSPFGPLDWDYDCVSEWMMPDEAAFDAIMAIMADPVIGELFSEDEKHFLDRTDIRLLKCHVDDDGGDLRTPLTPAAETEANRAAARQASLVG